MEGEIFDIVSDFFSVWPLDGDRGGVNSHLNSILTQIEGSVENPSEVLKLVAEGKQLIKKRQKLIKIADRNKLRRVGLWLMSTSPTISRLIHAEDEKKFCEFCCWGLVVVPTELAPVLDKKNKESSEDQKLRHTPMVTLREYFVFSLKYLLNYDS